MGKDLCIGFGPFPPLSPVPSECVILGQESVNHFHPLQGGAPAYVGQNGVKKNLALRVLVSQSVLYAHLHCGRQEACDDVKVDAFAKKALFDASL